MTKNTSINWTDYTFNPWWGCTPISFACGNCLSHTLVRRAGQQIWGEQGQRRFMGDEHWNLPVTWNTQARAAGKRKRVLCASMADVFEDRYDLIPHRDRLLRLIDETPHLDWLLLTMRPDLITTLLPDGYQFPSNVWLGTTIEMLCRDQLLRIQSLLKFTTPAKRFLVCTPQLVSVDIRKYLQPGQNGVRIDLVITEATPIGGGRLDRKSEQLLEQCEDAGVEFHDSNVEDEDWLLD